MYRSLWCRHQPRWSWCSVWFVRVSCVYATYMVCFLHPHLSFSATCYLLPFPRKLHSVMHCFALLCSTHSVALFEAERREDEEGKKGSAHTKITYKTNKVWVCITTKKREKKMERITKHMIAHIYFVLLRQSNVVQRQHTLISIG